ncbi:MAG: DUF427 domain-containing protein [Candidatus Thiodiazotropha weberae]|nr:DUF427 domain-containing protein [Candidatus Thiodiazotropha weberae]
MKAVWNGQIIAESNETVVVEFNHYFPVRSVQQEYLNPSDTTSVCPWKGVAHYYSLSVNGDENLDAAWYYPTTSEEAKNIEGMVAFWKGVEIID